LTGRPRGDLPGDRGSASIRFGCSVAANFEFELEKINKINL